MAEHSLPPGDVDDRLDGLFQKAAEGSGVREAND